MPHMAHMMFAGVMCTIFGAMTLIMVRRPAWNAHWCVIRRLNDAQYLSCRQEQCAPPTALLSIDFLNQPKQVDLC
jgi:hypothetical protein